MTGVSLSKNVRQREPTLLVTWIAPQSDVNITAYRVQYRRIGTSLWGSQISVIGSPLATAAALPPLWAGTAYSVRVRAESAAGYGVWSEVHTEKTFDSK